MVCKKSTFNTYQEYLVIGYFAGIKGSEEFDMLIRQMRQTSFPSIDVSKWDGLKEQAHITLAHLGKQRPDTERFQDVGQSREPFEISIEGVKIFSNQQTTHLVLPIVHGSDELRMLNAHLRTAGKVLDRGYTPHMTVVSALNDRRGETDAYRQMLLFREKYHDKVWGRMVVTSFHLFTSTQGVCRAVDVWRLSGKGEVM